eukprot:COSAG01_NODE_3393_length_6149_cov_24.742149_6_plen_75_part_00
MTEIPLRFRLVISVRRTEDEINSIAGKSQPLLRIRTEQLAPAVAVDEVEELAQLGVAHLRRHHPGLTIRIDCQD